ncbi:MAG: SMP-30/gluconolactonase/LRE family protein [Bacteroidales bacterium]|nr:SMP-30/gluconolactonase/LRE family protein [Bacteroidales bacterium]
MNTIKLNFTSINQITYILSILLIPICVHAQNDIIPFNSDNWQIFSGKLEEHLGRQSLSGSAMLKDVEFEDGIIEFDIAVTGQRSYPGIRFRAQSRANAENIYIRPHIIGVSQDALQYTPIFNNEACWQLYNGDGFTTGIDMPENEWVHVKIEVSGSQARVYIGNTKNPTLKIEYLKHGKSKGGIALISPANGSAHFSNFKINSTAKLNFNPPLKEETPPGMITDWEISQPFKYSKIDLEKNPIQQGLTDIKWQKVNCEESGLVNISRNIQRRGREPDFIFARTFLESDKTEIKELKFGYSDYIVIFLNGELLFSGSSPYQGRGTAFLGIIGLYDAVMLPLKKGQNELLLIVGETFGGWGFMCQDGKAVYQDRNLKKLWETERVFTTSESVLYDPKREVLYVTNFDQFNMGNPRAQQFISKVSLDGEIEDLKWVDSLNNPLGITIHNDRLFVTERKAIAEIDLDKGEVIKRYPIPGSVFLNDIAIDDSGKIYITDSRKNVIWRYSDGAAEEWLTGDEVIDPNVLYVQGDILFFGNSGDQSLKSVNLLDKSIKTIAKFETGFIDGFRIDNNGNYLVSLWRGKLFRVTPQGEVTKILDTTTPGYYSADFEYIKEKKMLIIPTFFGNTLTAYGIK